MEMKEKKTSVLLHLLQGALIGFGAVLPGVSGGVLCVVFGVYKIIMELMSHPIKALQKNMRTLVPVIVGVVIGNPSLDTMPVLNKVGNTTPVFPVLFTTIACGAISGFHSLVGSGTTSKQLDKEKDAKPIAYGGMLIECLLAILTLCAVAHAYSFNGTDLAFTGATAIFGGGIASMIDPSRGGVYNVLYTLLVLTYSTFCLTSLDTATRLGRFMFQEFWVDASKGETPENVTGYKKVLSNPYVATVITVVLGILLGMNGYGKIWALVGSAPIFTRRGRLLLRAR